MAKHTETAGPRLRNWLRVIIRRKVTIGLVTALFVVPAFNVALLRSSVYAASARVLLQATTASSLLNPATGTRADPARLVKTQLEVFSGEPLRAAVQANLGSVPDVSVKDVGGTDVIEITARNGSPRTAAAIADAYADAYVEPRRQQRVDTVPSAGQQVQAKADEAQNRLDDLEAEVAAASPDRQTAVRQSLAPERAALVSQLGFLQTKRDQLQIHQAITNGGAEIIRHARVPSSPVWRRPARSGLMALARRVGGGPCLGC